MIKKKNKTHFLRNASQTSGKYSEVKAYQS